MALTLNPTPNKSPVLLALGVSWTILGADSGVDLRLLRRLKGKRITRVYGLGFSALRVAPGTPKKVCRRIAL